MLTISTFITAPIALYLQSASTSLGIDLQDGRLIPVDDWSDKNHLYQCKYKVVATDLSQLTEASPTYSVLSIQYMDTIQREHSRGSSILGHQLSIGVTSREYTDAVNIRDFAISAIEHGLESGDLSFPLYSWAGSYSVLTKTMPRLIEQNRMYLSRSTILLKLSKI
jgi:hypothetical protein